MGVASLVLGILSALLGMVPFCNYFAFIPAVIGLGLGIAEIVSKSKKKEPKGMGIAGTILSGVAILFIAFWTLIIGVIAISEDWDSYDNDYDYDCEYDYDYDYDYNETLYKNNNLKRL